MKGLVKPDEKCSRKELKKLNFRRNLNSEIKKKLNEMHVETKKQSTEN